MPVNPPETPIEARDRRLAARRERFEMLVNVAQRVLYDGSLTADKQHRTVWCHRAVKNTSERVGLWRRQDRTSSRLTGVITCGSVWTCVICSARVAERRREELQRAMVRHIAGGGHVYLLTLTFPHERTLPLAEGKRLFAKALQKFKNSKGYKRVSKAYARVGSVRSLEITWGPDHGWHVHTHDLVFAAPGLDGDLSALDELRGAWINALLKVGLGSPDKVSWMWEHALDIRGGAAAAEYVVKFGHDSKWGITSEVTRQHAKVGMRAITAHQGHVTPFQMLAWAGEGDAEAVRLFIEFAAVFKDARMLYWSPGLKKKLGLVDLTDEQVAADETPKPDEAQVAEIDSEDLALVHSRGALGELLQFVCLIDGDDKDHLQACVDDFLEAVRCRPRTARGQIRQKRWNAPGFNVKDPDGYVN